MTLSEDTYLLHPERLDLRHCHLTAEGRKEIEQQEAGGKRRNRDWILGSLGRTDAVISIT